MEMVIIFVLGVAFVFANDFFWYVVVTWFLSSLAFSYFADVMNKASYMRRKYYNGCEGIDHADESIKMYKDLGPFVSLFIPILPIIVAIAAFKMSKKLDSRLCY